ncbi:MAG TPA: serine acetyltransferase [Myxococcota bacterium]|jgi:serine O-acetyltransferase
MSLGLFELVARLREDWEVHERDWTRPGFRALAVHRFGNWRMNIEPKVVRAPFSMAYRMLERHCRNNYGIEIPYSVQVGRRVKVEHQGDIVVHGATVIGDDVVLRQGVTLGMRDVKDHRSAPNIGNHVDIGCGAKILGPINVGEGASIGANAVVLEDVPEGALAVGVPARIIPKEKRKGR